MEKIKIYSIFIATFLILNLSACTTIFGSLEKLPKGEYIAEYKSPTEEYTLITYLCSGNATTDYSIRGELVCNSNDEKSNIYWSYHEEDAVVEWISDYIVSINGIELDVSKGQTYDWRK